MEKCSSALQKIVMIDESTSIVRRGPRRALKLLPAIALQLNSKPVI